MNIELLNLPPTLRLVNRMNKRTILEAGGLTQMTCSSISMECECPHHHHHQPSAARRGVKTPNHGSTTSTAPTQGTGHQPGESCS